MFATSEGRTSPVIDQAPQPRSEATRAVSNTQDSGTAEREQRLSFWVALMRALASIHT